jgi:hypothetical protein
MDVAGGEDMGRLQWNWWMMMVTATNYKKV